MERDADRLAPELVAAHDAAVAGGEAMYQDPNSGYWVMTAVSLLERGTCCGSGCRHCPYPTGTADGSEPAG